MKFYEAAGPCWPNQRQLLPSLRPRAQAALISECRLLQAATPLALAIAGSAEHARAHANHRSHL